VDRLAGTLAAAGATLIEVLPIRVDDNLTIPLTAGAIMFSWAMREGNLSVAFRIFSPSSSEFISAIVP